METAEPATRRVTVMREVNWDQKAERTGYDNPEQMFKALYRRWPWETEKFNVIQLADVLGICAETVLKELKRRKLHVSDKPLPWDRIARELGYKDARHLFLKKYATCDEDRKDGKLSSYQLAKVLGVTPTTIVNKVRALGIPRAEARAPLCNSNHPMRPIPNVPEQFSSEKEWLEDLVINQRLPRYMVLFEVRKQSGWKISLSTLRYRLARYGIIPPYYKNVGNREPLLVAPDGVKEKRRKIQNNGSETSVRGAKGAVPG